MDGAELTWEQVLSHWVIFAPKLAAALVLFIFGIFVAGLTARGLRRAMEARNTDPEITLLVTRVTRMAIAVMSAIVALDKLISTSRDS